MIKSDQFGFWMNINTCWLRGHPRHGVKGNGVQPPSLKSWRVWHQDLTLQCSSSCPSVDLAGEPAGCCYFIHHLRVCLELLSSLLVLRCHDSVALQHKLCKISAFHWGCQHPQCWWLPPQSWRIIFSHAMDSRMESGWDTQHFKAKILQGAANNNTWSLLSLSPSSGLSENRYLYSVAHTY